MSYPADLDHFIDEIVTDSLITKDLKRLLKKNAAIVHENAVFALKCKAEDLPRKIKGTETTVRESVLEKNAGAVILNDLPFDKALELFRKHG